MLTPRSVHLHAEQGGLVSYVSSTTPIERYIGVMRTLQQRTGRPPRSVLENSFPVLITTDAGALRTSRVSGIPHGQRPEHEPIVVDDHEQVVFLKRGDHILMQVLEQEALARKYMAVSYDLAPQLLLSDDPITLQQGIGGTVRDVDAVRLLEIAQERELAPVEQFFASFAMPAIWKQSGGGLVPVFTRPSPEDVRQCIAFAAQFTAASSKLAVIAKISEQWSAALNGPAAPTEDGHTPDGSGHRPPPRMRG